MDFNNLVLNVLNESPDNLEFEGKWYYFNDPYVNPITFLIDGLRYSSGTGNNTYRNTKLGYVVIYFTPVPDNKWVSHNGLLQTLYELYYRELLKTEAVHFFSPKVDVKKHLDELYKKYPNLAIETVGDGIDEIPPEGQGRMWKVKDQDKVLVALWDEDPKVIEEYIIPFVQHVYPNISIENILIENAKNKLVPANRYSKTPALKTEPYEKELANLQRQLHLASGDEKKKQKLRSQIKEIALKHNLDPKKYGIDDELLKGSQLTAKKLLSPNSKETMASLRARTTQSESKLL